MTDEPYIWEQRPPSPRFAKGLLVTVAVAHLVFGWGAYDSPTVTWLYQVWPPLFLAASIMCVVAAARFQPRPVALAGGLTVVAYASRAGVLVCGFAYGRIELDLVRIVFGGAVWLMLAFYASVLWLRGLGPLAHLWSRGQDGD